MAHAAKDVSYEWFLKANLSKFKGMYIAIVDGQVVEHGDNPREVYEKARRRFPSKEVVLWKVPREEALIL